MTNKIIKYSHDPEANAIYITLSDSKVAYTKSLDHSRLIDYDRNDEPIGIELLFVSDGVATADLPFENEIIKLLENKHVKILV